MRMTTRMFLHNNVNHNKTRSPPAATTARFCRGRHLAVRMILFVGLLMIHPLMTQALPIHNNKAAFQLTRSSFDFGEFDLESPPLPITSNMSQEDESSLVPSSTPTVSANHIPTNVAPITTGSSGSGKKEASSSSSSSDFTATSIKTRIKEAMKVVPDKISDITNTSPTGLSSATPSRAPIDMNKSHQDAQHDSDDTTDTSSTISPEETDASVPIKQKPVVNEQINYSNDQVSFFMTDTFAPSTAAPTHSPTTESPTPHPSSMSRSTIIDCRAAAAAGNDNTSRMEFNDKDDVESANNWKPLDFLYTVETMSGANIEEVQVALEEELLKLVASELLSCGRRRLLDDSDTSSLTHDILGGSNPKESRPNMTRKNWRRLEASALDSSPPDVLQKEVSCPEVSENTCYLFEGKMRFLSDGTNQEEEEFVFNQSIQNTMKNRALIDNSSILSDVMGVSYVNDPSDLDKFVAPSSAKVTLNSTTGERTKQMTSIMIGCVFFASMCLLVLLVMVTLKRRRSRAVIHSENMDDLGNHNKQDIEEAPVDIVKPTSFDMVFDDDLEGLQFVEVKIDYDETARTSNDTDTVGYSQSSSDTDSDSMPSSLLTLVDKSILRFAQTCGFANLLK